MEENFLLKPEDDTLLLSDQIYISQKNEIPKNIFAINDKSFLAAENETLLPLVSIYPRSPKIMLAFVLLLQ